MSGDERLERYSDPAQYQPLVESAVRGLARLDFDIRAVVAGGYMEQLLDGAGPLPVLFSVSDDRWRETMQTELLAAPDIELPADGWQPWIRRTA